MPNRLLLPKIQRECVEDDSLPLTSHKHKVFQCRLPKALANGINGELWEAEARPLHVHSEGRKRQPSLSTKPALVSILQG